MRSWPSPRTRRATEALCRDDGATLDDFREAATTLEEIERTSQRVFGGTHPLTVVLENCLRNSRAMLRASEAREDVVS